MIFLGGISSRFEIPTYRRVVENAMHVYGPPIEPPIQMTGYRTTDQLMESPSSAELLVFPFMKFSCGGAIRKLTFVAGGLGSTDYTVSPSNLPEFTLWRHNQTDGRGFSQTLPVFSNDHSVISYRNGTIGIIEVDLTLNLNNRGIQFKGGNFLGLIDRGTAAQVSYCHSNGATALVQQDAISVLRQMGGYSMAKTCSCYIACDDCTQNQCQLLSDWMDQAVFPYIAVETGDNNSYYIISYHISYTVIMFSIYRSS